MLKRLSIFLLLLNMSIVICNAEKVQRSYDATITLLCTTDIHGAFFPYDFVEGREMPGSMARVMTYVGREREIHPGGVILLDNGDMLQGQPICYYYNYVKNDGENVATSVARYMGFDAQTIGNHEVETGHSVYDKWIRESPCPILGANVVEKSSGKPYLKPYTIITRNGVKIAVLGLVTPAIPNWLHESLWHGLEFEDMVSSAKKWMTILREKEHPDVVVGLFHSGWDKGITTSSYSENETERIAREVPGFDVIFFGHDHVRSVTTVKSNSGDNVLCLNAASKALGIAHATLCVTWEKGKAKVCGVTGNVESVASETPDAEYMEHFSETIEEVKGYVGRKIGRITDSVHSRDCFFGNAALTDFIHSVQLEMTGADISFTAPLGFDSHIEAGDIGVGEMVKLYRFENTLYVLKMTGKEILRYLEMSYSLWTNTMKTKDDHIMLLRDKGTSGKMTFQNFTFNFDSAAGLEYVVDVTKPVGQKVRILGMSNGTAFDENRWYKVAMNSYRGNGGGELLTNGAGIPKEEIENRIIMKSERDIRHYVMEKIEREKTVTLKAGSNWRFVPEEWTVSALQCDRTLLFGE